LAELSQMGIQNVYNVIATQTTVTLASLAKYLTDVSLPRVVGLDANIAIWSERTLWDGRQMSLVAQRTLLPPSSSAG
jgi:hypothetical protein